MKHKRFSRHLCLLLAIMTLLGCLTLPASAATLGDSKTVTIQMGEYANYLSKSTGGTLGGGLWDYTSNDGLTGTAYCVNWGLKAVSPSKALPLQPYNRNPQTMGAYANGCPSRTLAQFKELHKNDVDGVDDLTESEYQYATQVAVWASCGQISVPGTSFTSGRASVVRPTSDAQQIRIYDSVVAILKLAAGWTKSLYTGMYVRAEEDMDVRGVEVTNEQGLEGAAAEGTDGIKKETINGREYYTRVMYVASATSTWIDDYKTKVYSTDAPSGTIFVAQNNSPLETVTEGNTTYYKVDTHQQRNTNLNANGVEYYGAFKVCIPVDGAADEGSFTIQAIGGVAQFNLFLAYNASASEQSYIVSDPGYTTCDARASFKWLRTWDDTASLQVVKAGPGGSPLEGAEFTLTGSGGTVVTNKSDRNGQILWTDLPANESYTLVETAAPEGYTVVEPINIMLTAGRTAYVTVKDNTEKSFRIKKVDSQNKSVLRGGVFRFEQIDGPYITTGTTGFDGVIEFIGDELPYGSYRVTEQSSPEGYVKSSRVETVKWTGERDVVITWENDRDIGLRIVKVDEQTGVSLPDATFDVYADGKKITSVTTNGAGEAYVTGISKEAYIEVVETASPVGYVLDRTSHGIHIDPYDPTIEDDPILTITNRAMPSLRILKYDLQSNSPLPNATFEVYHDGELFGEYTTNESGEINLYDLQPGTYLVKEIAVDDAHVVNSTPQQIELKAGANQTYELVFFNSLKPGIHLVKVDSVTMKSLPNVRFEFKMVGGSYRQEFTTDINGEIDLSKLTPAAYEVRELEAPKGYLIDDAVRVVQINPDENANFVFTNTPKPSFHLIKTSSDGTPLKGVTFRIAKIEDGTQYLDRTTDRGGEIVIYNMEPGVYSVQETATDSSHILDLREYHVELFPGQTSTLAIENQRRPNLTVYKNDADSGEPVPNTVFLVKTADGHSVDEIKTDATGKATLPNLLPGVYKISEKSVPSNYLMDADPQLVTLYPNRDHTVYFKNHQKPSLTILKLDSITGDFIKNAKFQIWYGSNSTTTGELNNLGIYYTNAEGKIHLDNLRDGWYRATELAPAAGYSIKEPATQEIYIEGGGNRILTYKNTPLNAIIVQKYDRVTGAALSGCTFQLRFLGGASGTGGTTIGQKVTSGNGTATWTGLQAGTYIVEEVDPGANYSIIQSSETVFLADSGDQSVITVRFENTPDGSLLIRKVCSVNPGVTLKGAEFLIKYADGTLIGDSNGIYVSDENGEVRIPGLKPGKSVIVTETRAPAGFLIDTQSQTIQIQEGKAVSLTFANQPKGAIIIQKRGPDNEVLEGVEFRLTTAAGCEVGLDGVIGNSTLTQNGIFRTDSQGEIRVSNLVPGAYVISELSTKEGYVITNPSTNVVIGPNGDTQTVVIRNDRAGSLLLTKKDAVTGTPLSNVEFLLTDSDGQVIGNANGKYVTDSAGTILVTGLIPGTTVIAKETRTRANYVLDDTPQSIKIKANETVSLEFRNQPAGKLVILKESSLTGQPLEGVTFKVTAATGKFVADENGQISSNGLYKTDKEGKITITGVVGSLVVTEVRSIPGYSIDPGSQTQTVVVEPNDTQTLRFFNTPSTTLIIEKYLGDPEDGNVPLKGVTFLVTDSSGAVVGNSNGEYVTDEAGQIVIEDLTPGITVTAREIKSVEGVVLDGAPKSILIKEGDVQYLRFYDQKAGTLVIRKLDKLTKQPLSGVEFQLTYANGGYVDADNGHLSSNGLYTTDANGEIRVSGITGTVVIKETRSLPGYTIDPETQTQTVTVNPEDTQTITVYNIPSNTLTINKYVTGTNNEPLAGVTFLITDSAGTPLGSSNGEYITDRNGQIVLSGLTPGTTIIAKEVKTVSGFVLDGTPQSILIKDDGVAQHLTFWNTAEGGLELIKVNETDKTQRIPNTTFEIRRMDGGLVDTVTTDKTGRVHVNLGAGDYYAVEIEAAQGFKLDNTPHYFTVKDGAATTLTVTNKSFSGILIHKTNSATGKGVYGAVFLLYDSTMTPIGQYTSDNSGYAYIEGLTTSGRYYLRELENKGYVVDTQMKTVYVTAGETTLVEWKNTPITGQIQIWKKSADDNPINGFPAGTALEGAVFEIYDKANNLVDTIKSNSRGLAVSSQLPLGRYTVKEVQAPAYYSINSEAVTVYLEHSGQIVQIEVLDSSVYTNVSVHKTGYTEVVPGQSLRYTFSEIANNSTVPLDNFYFRDTLPTDAVRLDKIITGTWSAKLTYKIVYKTNLSSEYRTLKDNLQTAKNYTVNASPAALGLAANEYVTEITFLFGRVPAGFTQLQTPYVYCTVLPGLAHEYRFTNKTDVGGVWQGQWAMANDRWVTIVYNKTTPPKLPRTGY